uniref:Uncharacterized protein n=1 Tax=Angiostrongylus cantonensis TaxID=6313 RepID=A0A158P6T9_ANGCA
MPAEWILGSERLFSTRIIKYLKNLLTSSSHIISSFKVMIHFKGIISDVEMDEIVLNGSIQCKINIPNDYRFSERGRYWASEEPQCTLYVPSAFLRPGKTLMIKELENTHNCLTGSCSMSFIRNTHQDNPNTYEDNHTNQQNAKGKKIKLAPTRNLPKIFAKENWTLSGTKESNEEKRYAKTSNNLKAKTERKEEAAGNA